MTGSIICGLDDSEAAEGAARVARGLSAKLGLRLVFVRVLERGADDAMITAVAQRLSKLAAGVSDVDGGAGWIVDIGHPADRLLAVAARAGAAAIVIGSHGRRSSLSGSVSAEVSRRAPCPVVVVAPGADRALAGNRNERSAGRFPGLADDGYVGHAAVASLSGTGLRRDSDARELAGGIVRFSLGSGRS